MRLARTGVRCDESGKSEGDECVVELHCVFRVGFRKMSVDERVDEVQNTEGESGSSARKILEGICNSCVFICFTIRFFSTLIMARALGLGC